MKTALLLTVMCATSLHAANIFSYDNNAQADFRDVNTNFTPPEPVQVEIVNDQPSYYRPDPSGDFERGVEAQAAQQAAQDLNNSIDDYNRNAAMQYYRQEQTR